MPSMSICKIVIRGQDGVLFTVSVGTFFGCVYKFDKSAKIGSCKKVGISDTIPFMFLLEYAQHGLID